MTETPEGSTHQTDANEPLYRHTKRAEWGLAILAWEKDNTRGYQFQDGELRIIKSGFYHLLGVAEHPPEGGPELVAELRRQAGLLAEQQRSGGKKASISFADQVTIFRTQHAEGFAGESWQSHFRGTGVSRRLKRHRQAAIDQARELLADSRLQQTISDGANTELVENVIALLGTTDLVKPKDLDGLRKLPPDRHADYVVALHDMLYGDDPLDQRFDRLVRAVGRSAGWPVTTAPAALVVPEALVCIQPSMIRRQAQVLDQTLSVGTEPNGRVHQRLIALVGRVRDLLVQASFPPTDLMDIYDFMAITLRPSAARLLKEA